jgi:uncharacterized RDD family membrane protein YckC
MSAPLPNEPPPLPPPASPQNDSGFPVPSIVAEKSDDVAPTPATAPLFWRMLAYILDWLLACLVFFAVMKWFVLPNYEDGITALKEWVSQFWDDYAQMLRHPASTFSASMEQAQAFGQRAAKGLPESASDMITALGWFQTFFFWAYFFVVEYFSQGQSLGKRIFHLRVANSEDMGAPGILDSLLRSAWKAFFFCSPNPVMLFIGILDAHVPLFSRTRRAWHDMISRTIVVDENTSPLETEADEEEDGKSGNDDEPSQ